MENKIRVEFSEQELFELIMYINDGITNVSIGKEAKVDIGIFHLLLMNDSRKQKKDMNASISKVHIAS